MNIRSFTNGTCDSIYRNGTVRYLNNTALYRQQGLD